MRGIVGQGAPSVSSNLDPQHLPTKKRRVLKLFADLKFAYSKAVNK